MVKKLAENSLFWSDEEKRRCYDRWAEIYSEQFTTVPQQPNAKGDADDNDGFDVDKITRLNELLAVADAQAIETTERRKHCPRKCLKFLVKQHRHECTFFQTRKAVIKKKSSTLLKQPLNVNSAEAKQMADVSVKAAVDLSKAVSKLVSRYSDLRAAKNFTASQTASASRWSSRETRLPSSRARLPAEQLNGQMLQIGNKIAEARILEDPCGFLGNV